MGKRSVGLLVVAIFVGMLAGNVIGEGLGVVFDNLGLQNNVVQKVLVDPLYEYEFYPMRLNFIAMTLTLGFSIKFNVLSLIGIGTAWYYVKYSY
jgi:predicted lysophospholipase L1 biosynthesis ABC-type transport system permease subunit